ncbi:hypothetical protein K0T92_00055 [Paenibacillus oenotherae]|uniref:Uncharacterized protein n=1 Tax=Paenibacillus oenotherae TaxID=1435645 RepID=A0ABS7D0P6_9BACL|nr:hypothetical protein [Paenibacillus oenotherae]MBW7473127.1 hypothetical protein [Paenibacillus oenotherae]
MAESRSSCSIERTAIVISVGQNHVVAAVNGKNINIPASKVVPSVKPDDRIQWNGSLWTVIGEG